MGTLRSFEINGPTNPNEEFEVTLSGRTYFLRFNWNVSLGRWVIRILDSDKTVLVSSRTVVLSENLFRGIGQHLSSKIPNIDKLYMVVSTGLTNKNEPTRESFSNREASFTYMELRP